MCIVVAAPYSVVRDYYQLLKYNIRLLGMTPEEREAEKARTGGPRPGGAGNHAGGSRAAPAEEDGEEEGGAGKDADEEGEDEEEGEGADADEDKE